MEVLINERLEFVSAQICKSKMILYLGHLQHLQDFLNVLLQMLQRTHQKSTYIGLHIGFHSIQGY